MLTPERRAELRGLAESAQPFIRHGGTDPAAVYVPATDLAALLDAAEERDRLAAALKRSRDMADLLAAGVSRVGALAVEYEEHALREGYGGELWSTTAAAIRRALDGADDE